MQLLLNRKIQYLILAILVCAAGLFFYFRLTHWGAVVGFDSYIYLRSAEGLLSTGNMGWMTMDGTFIHSNHYPPMYSAILAAVSSWFHISILIAARWVVVGSVVLILALAFILYFDVEKPVYLAVLFCTLFFVTTQFIDFLTNAMSEAVFYVFFLLFLFSMNRFIRSDQKRFLIVTGLSAGMALLTRYAAVSMLITGALMILVFHQRKFLARFIFTVVFGIISSAPLLLWIIARRLTVGDFSARKLAFHLPAADQWMTIPRTIRNFISPVSYSDELQLVLLIGILLLFVFVLSYRILTHHTNPIQISKTNSLSILLSIFLAFYPLTLLLSYTFFDASTPWGGRILSPWIIAGFILFLINIPDLGRINNSSSFQKTLGWVSIISLIVLTLIKIPSVIPFSDNLIRKGSGFTSRDFQKSDLIQSIRQLPATTFIYTNNVPAIYFNTARESLPLPEKVNTLTTTGLQYYDFEMNRMHSQLKEKSGYLILFKPYHDKNGILPTLAELTPGMKTYQKFTDGTIYIAIQ